MIAAVAIVADHAQMEVDTLARTLWGEARGEGFNEWLGSP